MIEAYQFLCSNYSGEGDEIFLIGFSRGAFAGRCLANIVSSYGLLATPTPNDIHDLYTRWSRSAVPLEQNSYASNRRPRIKACALWDTVGATGIPVPRGIVRRHLAFIHSEIPSAVENAFQALALHEHRYHFFPIVLWRPRTNPSNQRLEQCWFAGYHADVGGGRKRDALAHFALVWIISKLQDWISFNLDSVPDPWMVS